MPNYTIIFSDRFQKQMEEEKQTTRPTESSDDDRITIQILTENGHELNYRVRKWTKMSTLMAHYAGRKNTTADELVFIYNGEVLLPGDTPETLEMSPEDEIIEVYPRRSYVTGVAH